MDEQEGEEDDAWLVNLESYRKMHHREISLSVSSSGSVTFPGLTGGRSYTVIAWVWAKEYIGGEEWVDHEAMDINRVTVSAGQTSSVNLSLGDQYHKFFSYMLGYGMPVVQVLPTFYGSVEADEGESLLFGIDFVAIRSLGQVDGGYRHHIYMFPGNTMVDLTKTYDSKTVGGGRLRSHHDTFAELILVTAEPLLFEWVDTHVPISEFRGAFAPRVERASISTESQVFQSIWEGDNNSVTLYPLFSTQNPDIQFSIDGFSGGASWSTDFPLW